MSTDSKQDIRALSLEETKNLFQSIGQPEYRGTQLFEWIWQKSAASFEEMSNLPKDARQFLEENYEFRNLKIADEQQSDDGTIKILFDLFDGNQIEGVLIPTSKRITACISSQVGCSLACSFCATGFLDRKRNLNRDEIYDQVVLLNKRAEILYGRGLTNIVFMGMGEPLLNYRNVMEGIGIITSEKGLHMAAKRITVSTAGIAKMIRKMGDDKIRCNLALSLHAANDTKRSKIMAINKENNIDELVKSLDYYYEKTKNHLTFEYIIFKDFNDSEQDANELAELCRKLPVKVNIIEYNPVEGVNFKKADAKKTERFVEILAKRGISVSIRRSRGKDIDAACGQLAGKK
jgi:23S rRNA (adenine2503-C2)-methyltransferase